MKKIIEDIVKKFASLPLELMGFAYELRKADTEDKYSEELLKGNVKSQVLIDIILSNKWNKMVKELVPDENSFFRFVHDKHFLCYDINSKDQKPKLVQDGGDIAKV